MKAPASTAPGAARLARVALVALVLICAAPIMVAILAARLVNR
ncbi:MULTISPECIES: hypothetical protein [unclassified Sphingomonas]|nr:MULTISPECIES: hypothetical protein [unclassified Sphingomonas]